MERASRVQLQQYTNGAQPSVTGGVEGRPSAHGPGWPRGEVGPARTRPAGSSGPSKELRTEPGTTEAALRVKEQKRSREPTRMQSSQSLTTSVTPKSSVRSKSGIQMKKTGSQQSVGPRIRFQIETNDTGDSKTVK